MLFRIVLGFDFLCYKAKTCQNMFCFYTMWLSISLLNQRGFCLIGTARARSITKASADWQVYRGEGRAPDSGTIWGQNQQTWGRARWEYQETQEISLMTGSEPKEVEFVRWRVPWVLLQPFHRVRVQEEFRVWSVLLLALNVKSKLFWEFGPFWFF